MKSTIWVRHVLDRRRREASSLCGTLARDLDAILPDGPEKSTALRKLLECKDAAVRAALESQPTTKEA